MQRTIKCNLSKYRERFYLLFIIMRENIDSQSQKNKSISTQSQKNKSESNLYLNTCNRMPSRIGETTGTDRAPATADDRWDGGG